MPKEKCPKNLGSNKSVKLPEVNSSKPKINLNRKTLKQTILT
jgi:hypothetical protein